MRHSIQLDLPSPIESLNDIKFGSTPLTPTKIDRNSLDIDLSQLQLPDLSNLETKIDIPEIQNVVPDQLFPTQLSVPEITQPPVPEMTQQTLTETNILSSSNALSSSGGYCSLCTACGSGNGHSHNAGFAGEGTVAQFNSGSSKWNQSGGQGSPVDITYSFAPNFQLSGLSQNESQSLFREALGVWADVAPLNFQEIQDPGNGNAVDIRVQADFIDGNSNTLAFAFFPQGGDQTYDTGENWSSSLFLETAVHETGHSLGLGHESGTDAIMNPSIQGRFDGPGSAFLLQDDINGIRSIYGNGQGSVDSPSPSPSPTPTPSPSPAPTPTPSPTSEIDGTKGADTLAGGIANETIRGFAGNDRLEGKGGNDNLQGGSGNDIVIGSAGNDISNGGNGNDRLYAGTGNDKVDGGAGNDSVVGGTGNDTLRGGGGQDKLIGIYNSGANPGAGDVDILIGGEGADTFVLGDAKNVYYADGPATSNYAVVRDFDQSEGDVLQLNGQASDYSLGSSSRELPNGTALIYEGGNSRETIAIIQGDTNFSLDSDAVQFV